MAKVGPATDKDLADFGITSDDLLPNKEAGDTKSNVPTPSSPSSDNIYAGDLEDSDGPLHETWQTLDIPSPQFLVVYYLKAFREQQFRLYDWQKEQLQDIKESFAKATLHTPYKLALCAANGSGKDFVIVAPTVVWASLTNIRCLTIITSSSGNQLSAQTENYIRALCQTINEYHGEQIFRIRQRYIKCNLTGSEIRLFATDEAGKAEGYHPLEPGAKMLIVVNEAKSVSEEIYGALRRCTGYTHWLNISTPGQPFGFFHRACTKPALGYTFRHVDYTLCPDHMAEQERLTDLEELGANSSLYRSKWLALFTSLNSDSLIPTEVVDLLIENRVEKTGSDWPLRIGGDIAAGGDENALIATRGNVIVREAAMRERDTTLTADWFERQFIELGIDQKHEYIFMDDGGIGHAVIDMLRRKGWEIRRVRNETKAVKPQHYGNRGAELWYNAKRICEERLLRLDEASEKLREQISSRHYKKSNTGGRIFLESKKDAKAEGRPSPDRADALILSLTGLTVDDFVGAKPAEDSPAKPKGMAIRDEQHLAEVVDDIAFGEFETPEPNSIKNKRLYNSLAAATANDNKKEYTYAFAD